MELKQTTRLASTILTVVKFVQIGSGVRILLKDLLPTTGMKPHDSTYLGWFMCDRFTRQRNFDQFVHFLKYAANVRPPSYKQEFQLPPETMTRIGLQVATVDDDHFI